MQTFSPNQSIPSPVMPAMALRLTDVDIVDQLKTFNYRQDKNGALYLNLPVRGKNQWVDIRLKAVPAILSSSFLAMTKQYVAPNKMKDYLEIVSAQVVPQGPYLEHFTRIGKSGNEIVLDLCDGTGLAVFITAEGWSVKDNQEVIFRNFPHQLPLPIPVAGGSLDEFFEAYAINDPHQKMLLAAWLVAEFFADWPRAHLGLAGEKGTGKSQLAIALKKLIDPAKHGNFLNKNTMDMAQFLDHNAVPMFDNIGAISPDLSNLLCIAWSGGYMSTREKFTTDVDHSFDLKKGVILTSMDFGAFAPDLLDRIIMIKRYKHEFRNTTVNQIERRFDEMQPRVLGAVLNLVSGVMKRLPGFEPNDLIRNADYHRIGLIVSDLLGYGQEFYLRQAFCLDCCRCIVFCKKLAMEKVKASV